MLGKHCGIEGLVYSGQDVWRSYGLWDSKEARAFGKWGAGRRGKGGHSGGATLMVMRTATGLHGGCCSGDEVGQSLVELGQAFRTSAGGCAATWWRQLGADLVMIWGHLLCFWIMPDC